MKTKVIKKKIKRKCLKCNTIFSTETKLKVIGGIIPVREDKEICCPQCKKK